MPKRYNESSDDSPRKRNSSGVTSSLNFKNGQILCDLTGTKWKLGNSVGIGGFGEIYDIYMNALKRSNRDTEFVAKIEKHSNGPLFVEINCYLRIAKENMIKEWKEKKKLKFLGIPHYVASGSHTLQDEKFRFLIMPKYSRDLEKILIQQKCFNIKTVLTISMQILDVLEYIHSKGYIHSDIKASNIMLGKSNIEIEKEDQPERRTTRPKPRKRSKFGHNLRECKIVNYKDDFPCLDSILDGSEEEKITNNKNKELEHIFLLDYGLASKYQLSNGEHREFCTDERRAHAGTTLFCSRDAHKGVVSRRSDMECLAYNIIYWLTGTLPWINDLEEPLKVEQKKIRSFKHLHSFLAYCFNNKCPQFMMQYFTYLNSLEFQTKPDYLHCKRIFEAGFGVHGCKNDSNFDFDGRDDAVVSAPKVKRMKILVGRRQQQQQQRDVISANSLLNMSFLKSSPRPPLHSNVMFKRLRKQYANRKNAANNNNKKIPKHIMRWSKILMDPEVIIKQARKTTDFSSDPPGGGGAGGNGGGTGCNNNNNNNNSNLSLSELESLNPTYAMMEVYNRIKERETSPIHKCESPLPMASIEGYTPAMMSVYTKMKEREELEYQMMQAQLCMENNNNITSTSKTKESQGVVRKRSSRRKTAAAVATAKQRSQTPPQPQLASIVNNNNKKQQTKLNQAVPTKKIKTRKTTIARSPYRLRG